MEFKVRKLKFIVKLQAKIKLFSFDHEQKGKLNVWIMENICFDFLLNDHSCNKVYDENKRLTIKKYFMHTYARLKTKRNL